MFNFVCKSFPQARTDIKAIKSGVIRAKSRILKAKVLPSIQLSSDYKLLKNVSKQCDPVKLMFWSSSKPAGFSCFTFKRYRQRKIIGFRFFLIDINWPAFDVGVCSQ